MSSFGISPYARSVAAVARMARFEQENEEKKENTESNVSSSASSTASSTSSSQNVNLRNSMKYAVGHRFDTACDHY
jgi:hypothetical protein